MKLENIYEDDVSELLGSTLEHLYYNKVDINSFWLKFINSNIANQIENRNPKYCNLSSYDLIELIDNNIKIKRKYLGFAEYYWIGWVIIKYQYHTGYSFKYINKYLNLDLLYNLYHPLHECDINKVFDSFNAYFIDDNNKISNLKQIRLAYGISQSELSKLANVDIRSIQMYEQKRNNINKAQVDTLIRLSNVLGCKISDLLE